MNTIEPLMKYVEKGWGHEIWHWNSPEYCGKLLHINAGKQLSFHMHLKKDEVLVCFSGKVKVLYGDSDDISQAKEKILEKGQGFHVYRGLRHRLIALEDSDIIEHSTEHFDSDSFRIIKGD